MKADREKMIVDYAIILDNYKPIFNYYFLVLYWRSNQVARLDYH